MRWNVQRGVVVIPKSIHKNRMEQNIDIWDFQLSEEDMAQIAKLDLGHSEIVDHSDPGFVKMLHSMKVHIDLNNPYTKSIDIETVSMNDEVKSGSLGYKANRRALEKITEI